MDQSWPDVLGSLISGDDLDSDQTAWAMGEILAGEATPVQIAGFAVALRAKGETVEEVEGLVEAMYAARHPAAGRRDGCSTWSAPAVTGRSR